MSRFVAALALAWCLAGPAEAQLSGSVWFGVAAVEDGIEARFASGATLPNTANSFGADAAVISFDYCRLTTKQAAALSAGLHAWLAAPHSDTVYGASGSIAFSAAGSASIPGLDPVVVVQVYGWVNEAPGHHHGGGYAALTVADVEALVASLDAWLLDPVEEGLLFVRLFPPLK